jgi:hypothetical protein
VRVDLDAIELRLGTRYGEVVTVKADEVMALVAELRAARKVVELARDHYEMTHAPGGASYPLPDLGAALAAYDQVVGS